MSEHLHTVTIGGTEDAPTIEFTCHGDREAKCHQYPGDDCTCETWSDKLTPGVDEAGHRFVQHDRCWMQDWFDNDGVNPCAEYVLDDAELSGGYRIGMSGPVETEFDGDYVSWEFIDQPVGESIPEDPDTSRDWDIASAGGAY